MKRPILALFVVFSALLFSCAQTPRVDVQPYIQAEEVLSWEEDIARFDSLNAVEPSDAGTLLVTGSSSVRMWDSIHVDLAPYRVMQRGYGGAKLNDFDYYADRIIKPQTFKAILVFVANDISGGEVNRTPEEVLALFQVLVDGIRKRNPDTPVFWIEITPTPSRWHVWPDIHRANELIRAYCEDSDDLHFIPTFDVFVTPEGLPDSTHFRDDMLHLKRDAYVLWGNRIKSELTAQGIRP